MPGNVCYIPFTPGSGENGCFCCFATGRRVENKQTGCLRRNLRLAARIKYRITRLYHIKAGLAHKADCLFCVPALQKHAPAFRSSRQSILHCGNIDKHHDIVAEASADTEKMEELMVSEALAHTVKKWKL